MLAGKKVKVDMKILKREFLSLLRSYSDDVRELLIKKMGRMEWRRFCCRYQPDATGKIWV